MEKSQEPFEARAAAGPPNPPHEIRVLEVTIKYCHKRGAAKGQLKTRTIDVLKEGVDGLFWSQAAGDSIKPGSFKGDHRLPGPPPQGPFPECDIPPGGTSCCWWNGKEWVCPPDLD